MTKKNNEFSIKFSKMHSNNVIWDLSSSYKFFVREGYSKSKKTFEREVDSLNFFPKSISNQDLNGLKSLVFSEWQSIIDRKRFLSIFSSIFKFEDASFIFYEDKRGKKFWCKVDDVSDTSVLESANSFLKYVNHTSVIWPSNELLKVYFNIVDKCESESVCSLLKNSIIFPVTAFQKTLCQEDLSQPNHYLSDNSLEIKDSITHLEKIEAEAIHIIRETIAESENPVMLYSVGKDSAVMLHLAKKAFHPAPPPFPLLHVDTGWKFNEMYQFRDLMAQDANMELIVYKNQDGLDKNINPFDHGSEIHTDIMKTQALKKALDKYQFDFAFGGARRDEEKSRAKERILSFRSESHAWDPKNQRPELWDLYNFNKYKNESARVFPISNWTEIDIWQYIYKESTPIDPLYYSAIRPFVERDGTLIMVDDDRFKLYDGEKIKFLKARFRTLGCYPLTGAVESDASEMSDVLLELIQSNTTERDGRLIDSDSEGSMEKKKKEGYF